MSEQQAEQAAEPTDAPTDSSTDTGSGSSDSQGSEDTSKDVESGEPGEVSDAQLPEDLQPSEDNPLARHPEQTGDEDDEIGADREEDPETAPLRAEDADYGSGGAG